MPGFVDVYSDKSGGRNAVIGSGAGGKNTLNSSPAFALSGGGTCDSSSSSVSHGDRLLNFLLRNRAPSDSLPFQLLEGFNNTTKMRQNVLSSLLAKMKEEAEKREAAEALTAGPVFGDRSSTSGNKEGLYEKGSVSK